jgi:putative SOS response-associated peptidase YedK
MCGRYRRTTREEELARIYRIPIPSQPDLPISYNIAPSQEVLAIRFNTETKQRSLDRLRWGLVPYWAKDEKIGFKTINARAETVDSAHSFRSAFKKRRCLIPADGFYEWKKVIGGKIPYSIEMKDGSPFVFAGLWEGWQNPETKELLRTCTIITGQPNELVAEIHTRMPVILPPETHERWLTGESGKEVLRPFPAKEMKISRISTRVNKPENNDVGLLEEGEMEQVGRLI